LALKEEVTFRGTSTIVFEALERLWRKKNQIPELSSSRGHKNLLAPPSPTLGTRGRRKKVNVVGEGEGEFSFFVSRACREKPKMRPCGAEESVVKLEL